MKDEIIEILKNNSKDGWSGNHSCIGEIDFEKVAEELVKLLPISAVIKSLPELNKGEVLEYSCLGFPNDWYDVPKGIKDMKYFEPLKMRIRKPNGEIIDVV